MAICRALCAARGRNAWGSCDRRGQVGHRVQLVVSAAARGGRGGCAGGEEIGRVGIAVGTGSEDAWDGGEGVSMGTERRVMGGSVGGHVSGGPCRCTADVRQL